MGALREWQSLPDRMVFIKGSQQVLGSLITLLVLAVILLVTFFQLLEGSDGEEFLTVCLMTLVFGFTFLSVLWNAANSTRVVLDAKAQLATRVDSIFFIPQRRQALPFKQIRRVRVRSAGAGRLAQARDVPLWKVELEGVGASNLTVNERGTHAEMKALAERVAALVNRPIADALEEAGAVPSPRAEPLRTLSQGFSSLMENLTAMAGVGAPAEKRGPVPSQFYTPSPRVEETRPAQAREQAPPESVPSPRADELSATLAPVMVQAQSPVGLVPTTLPLQYSAPPLLPLPEMPPLFGALPTLNIPLSAPMGSTMPTSAAEQRPVEKETPPVLETPAAIRPSEPESSDDSANVEALYAQARKQHRAGAYDAAEEAYRRALRIDPGNAAIQNDLGVLYWTRGNLHAAESAFRRAVALNPFMWESRYNLGLLLTRTRRRTEAYEQFQIGARNAEHADLKRFTNALRGEFAPPQSSRERKRE